LNPTIAESDLVLGLPEPNLYLPTDFEILPTNQTPMTLPIIVEENENYEVWYKKDD
jgi:secreted Zn-dependent insulinase-like peptidase